MHDELVSQGTGRLCLSILWRGQNKANPTEVGFNHDHVILLFILFLVVLFLVPSLGGSRESPIPFTGEPLQKVCQLIPPLLYRYYYLCKHPSNRAQLPAIPLHFCLIATEHLTC